MGRPYSQDLRERVVDAVGTTSRRQAAAHFGVSVAPAILWMAALTTTGTVAPRPQGRARRSKLDPHEAYLRGLITERTDITLEEMRTRLTDERDLTVGLGTLWAFLDAHGGVSSTRSPQMPGGTCAQEGISRRREWLGSTIAGTVGDTVHRSAFTSRLVARMWERGRRSGPRAYMPWSNRRGITGFGQDDANPLKPR